MAQQPTSVQPKHSHYVSENGSIHPAMTYPSGYEDEHPGEWRPASRAEIQKYKAGAAGHDTVVIQPLDLDAVTDAAPVASHPNTLKLADEDASPVEIAAPVVVPAAAVPAPAMAIPPAAPKTNE